MGNTASHIQSWFGRAHHEDLPSSPIFPKTIFIIHKEELGLCEPQQISFKMPSAVPIMHFAENDNELAPRIDRTHVVPRNFWPQQELIEVNVRNENLKELVRMGYKRKHLTLHLMRFSPRAMVPKMKIRLGKLNTITDFIITFMLFPDEEDIGKIEKQDQHGFNNGVLFYGDFDTFPAHQIPVYENLLLNPGLIAMPPKEFDDHVAQITQAQARAEGLGRRPIEVPRDLPDLEGGLTVEKLSPDELKISWSRMAWTSNDWIGMFRPHSVTPALCIAKFTVKDHTQCLNVKMHSVPYGDLVLRYFRSEENVANSDIFSFGEDIELKVTEADAGLRIEVAGDLPKHWSLSMANNDKKLHEYDLKKKGRGSFISLREREKREEREEKGGGGRRTGTCKYESLLICGVIAWQHVVCNLAFMALLK